MPVGPYLLGAVVAFGLGGGCGRCGRSGNQSVPGTGPAASAARPILPEAVLRRIAGSVEVDGTARAQYPRIGGTTGETDPAPVPVHSAQEGEEIFIGDCVRTDRTGAVTVELSSEYIQGEIALGGETDFRVSELLESEVVLGRGRLRVFLSQPGRALRAFRAQTPAATFTARGTDFVLAAADDGTSRLHVVGGDVAVRGGGPEVHVTGGARVEVSPEGVVGTVESAPGDAEAAVASAEGWLALHRQAVDRALGTAVRRITSVLERDVAMAREQLDTYRQRVERNRRLVVELREVALTARSKKTSPLEPNPEVDDLQKRLSVSTAEMVTAHETTAGTVYRAVGRFERVDRLRQEGTADALAESAAQVERLRPDVDRLRREAATVLRRQPRRPVFEPRGGATRFGPPPPRLPSPAEGIQPGSKRR